MRLKRFVGLVGIAMVVVAFLLFSFRLISVMAFWIMAVCAAFIAWFVVPRIRS